MKAKKDGLCQELYDQLRWDNSDNGIFHRNQNNWEKGHGQREREIVQNAQFLYRQTKVYTYYIP